MPQANEKDFQQQGGMSVAAGVSRSVLVPVSVVSGVAVAVADVVDAVAVGLVAHAGPLRCEGSW